jgi:predicted methyltransferase
MLRSTPVLAAVCVTWMLSACTTQGPTTTVAASADTLAARSTAAAIERALAGDHRDPANRARDAARHPLETLMFFGLREDATVVEIWPGGAGWYTEVLAPVLRERGTYYAAQYDPGLESEYVARSLEAYRSKLAARPDVYDHVIVTALSSTGTVDIAPPGTADLVVSFRNVHNWMAAGWAPQALAAMYRALKPGGILGLVEHRGNPDVRQDPKATSGYVNQAYAIELARAAGFELLAASEINANPRDTKDYEAGVWSLPPTYRLRDVDQARYAAIGESDRYTLKFVKPVR